jgi:hypothetical protein
MVTFAKSPPHSNQAIISNYGNNAPIAPPAIFHPPLIQQVSPRSFQSFPSQTNQGHMVQRIVHNPVFLPPKQVVPIPFQPISPKAPKFTV